MSKYACVDVGGTFTDAAVVDENGSVNVFKSPTTPHDWTEGILGALKVAAEHYEEPFDDFLKDISVVNAGIFTHGSTIATNAVVEKKCGKVGILCTEGFRDVFLFREGPNKNPFDMFLDYPEPFVPRYLTLPVKERINSEGGVDTPLDEEAVREQTRVLKGYNVEAIAVCFLWSTVNPAHERRAREIIHEVWPEVTVVLSSEVNPSNREYRRWVSAAMDASLRKLISSYANDLNSRLNDAGFIGKVGMLNAAGGVMSTNEIVNRPLFSDIVSEYSGSHYTTTADFDYKGVNTLLKALRDEAMQFFARNHIEKEYQRIELYMEAHYPFQVYELPVNITADLNEDFEITPAGVKAMEQAFHKEHERTFSIKDDTFIECVSWRVKAIGKHEREAKLPEAKLPTNRDLAYEEGKSSSFRKIYFKEYDDLKMTPVFPGSRLIYGDVVHGPAIIEEPTTTIVVLPGYCAKVTKHNSYCLEKETLKKA